MAIDPLSETIVSLADAARLCPTRRRGMKPHVSCMYRSTVSGCKGVVLESIQVGGTRCTSREALARFFEALTYGDDRPAVRCPARRQRALTAAIRELESQGI